MRRLLGKRFTEKLVRCSVIVAMVLGAVSPLLTAPTPAYALDMTFYSESSDGYARAAALATWDLAHDLASASNIDATSQMILMGSTKYLGNWTNYRVFMEFDTSALPDGATITAATLSLYGAAIESDDAGYADLTIVEGTWAAPFDAADYGNHLLDVTPGSDYFSNAAWNTAAYNVEDLNATGLSWITTTGTTQFVVKTRADIDDTAPAGSNSSHFWGQEKGTIYRPKLFVTYTFLDIPSVTTDAADDITTTSVTLNATVTSDGGDAIDERGFEWDVDSGFPYAEDWTETGGAPYDVEAYDYALADLDVDRSYYYRAKVHNSEGWIYGDEVTFDTSAPPATAWLGTYDYRKRMGITNTAGAGALVDYTMRVQVYKDFGFNVVKSDDEFDLEREASTAVWVQNEGAIFTHGSDLGRTSLTPYTESDDRIYKYVPGSNPEVIAYLPEPLHHLGMAYSPDTDLIYTYGGGVDFTGGGNQIFWIDPTTETAGTAAEVLPYDLVAVTAVYSTVQKKTYLFGGFVQAAIGAIDEIWRHDPLTGEVIQLGATLPGDSRVFQAAVYVEPEDAIYLFGGLGEDVLTSYQDIYRFDAATETIELLTATTPDPMSKYMGAYYDPVLNAAVLAGGRHGPYGPGEEEGYTTRMWAFDLEDYSTYVMDGTIMGFVDDLAGVYNPDNGKGYFMRVTPEGYTGFSPGEPHSYGDESTLIAEVSSSDIVSLGGNSRDTFGDVRFTDEDGDTELDYWMEELVSGDYAVFWVEVASIPVSGTTIYIYYGDAAGTTTSDGDATFIFHDDFAGVTIDVAKWTEVDPDAVITQNDALLFASHPVGTWNTALYNDANLTRPFSIETKMITNSPSTTMGFGAKDNSAGIALADWEYWLEQATDGKHDIDYAGVSKATDQGSYAAGVDYWYRVAVPTTGARFYQSDDGVNYGDPYTAELTGAVDNLRVGFSSGNKNFQVAWVGVRKYAFPEPQWDAILVEEEEIPVARTDAADTILAQSAQLHGFILAEGSSDVTKYKFEWDIDSGTPYTFSFESAAGSYSIEAIEHSIASLTADDIYYFRFGAMNTSGYGYGIEQTFSTQFVGVLTSEVADSTATSATLVGTLTFMNSISPIYTYFEWGETSAYGAGATAEQTQTAIGGFTQGILGLTLGTEYHYRAAARYSPTDIEYGEDMVFTAGVADVPAVTTNPASGVADTTVTMHGNLTDLGAYDSVLVNFQYGLTATYGSLTVDNTRTTTGGYTAPVTGLTAGTVYHFRARVKYGAGFYVYGSDRTFTTSEADAPAITTGTASNVSNTSAKLTGNLTDLGAYDPVYVYFQYGATVGYGLDTAEQSKSAVTALDQTISGLTAGSTYHFRTAVRYNTDSYVYGNDVTFTTTSEALPGDPTVDPPDILAITDAKVFDGYFEDGDQIILLSYKLIYTSGTPIVAASDYFSFQVLLGDVIKAQIPVRMWGYRPGSIYLAPGSALPDGSTLTIKLIGNADKWDTRPEATFTITLTSWLGDVEGIDPWAISLAESIGSYYVLDMVRYSAVGGTLSERGGTIFSMGIPGLSTVRPSLFISRMETAVAYIDLGREDVLQLRLEPRAMLGDYIADTIEDSETFGFTLPEWLGWVVMGFYIAVVVGLGAVLKTNFVASIGIASPILIAGMWVGAIPVYWLMIVAAVAVMLLLKNMWLNRT